MDGQQNSHINRISIGDSYLDLETNKIHIITHEGERCNVCFFSQHHPNLCKLINTTKHERRVE